MSSLEVGTDSGTLLRRVIAEIPTKGDFAAVARVIDDLRTTVGREHCAALDVARIVLRDTGFASKLLRLVNSAFYRRQGQRVSTVTRAVMMVGFEAIADLASVILVVEELLRAGKASGYVREGLRSALYRGLLSQRLSAHVGYPKPEEAYLLGLFAELGTLWLATHYPADFAAATMRSAARDVPLEVGLREVLGGEPSTLSAGIVEAWGFPTSFVVHFRSPALRMRDAMHSPEARLSAIVQIAAEWTKAIDSGRPIDASVLTRGELLFGVPSEQLIALAREAHEVLRDQVAALGLGRVVEPPGLKPQDPAPPSPIPAAPADKVAETTAADGARAVERGALQAVADITRSIIERRDINDILLMVLESLVSVGDFDSAFLALVTVQRDRIIGRLACGVDAEASLPQLGMPLQRGAGLLADVVLERATRVISAESPAPASGSSFLSAWSLIALPLVVRDQCVGVLVATRAPQQRITAADQSLAELLCNQAAVALHHATG